MTGETCQDLLWNRVLHIAESLDDSQMSLEQLREQLSALNEGFAGVFDPAEHFPEFAAHRLCRSMERLFARLEASAQPNRCEQLGQQFGR